MPLVGTTLWSWDLIELVSLFSEHLRQADLSMLALRVVTARMLVILSGSFTSQNETGRTLTRFSDSQGIHSPRCWEPGFYTKYAVTGYWSRAAGVPGGCANHYATRASHRGHALLFHSSFSLFTPNNVRTGSLRRIEIIDRDKLLKSIHRHLFDAADIYGNVIHKK